VDRISWIKIATVFFYNQIKAMVRQVLGGVLGGLLRIPEDILLAVIGYFIMKRGGAWSEFGEGLLLGAVASIGATGGVVLGALFAPAQTTTTTQARQEVEVIT
jgi:hypothetical protein